MKACWIIGMVVAAGLPVQAEDCSVNVYAETGVALHVPLHPEVTAMAMFREIGIRVKIQLGKPPRHENNDCGDPILIELDDSTGYPGTKSALAYAMPYKESGASIHIFLDRLVRQNRAPDFVSLLLAHVMAHEITHVLEQKKRHSPEGVMKARWTYQDYQQMKRHALPFDAEDVEYMREGIARRAAHRSFAKMGEVADAAASSNAGSSSLQR